MRTLVVAICALAVGAPPISAQRVEKNVIFGMYSGLALLMDVRYPTAPKGRGVIFVPGSGFGASLRQDATPLKDANPAEVHALTDAGYTVFMVSHRAAPRFTYPAAVEDVQRAVRFVRANADRFGIDPQRIGAAGMSSGGHLVSMLGTLDGRGIDGDVDPINRVSARVQAVIALFAPVDLSVQFKRSDAQGIPEALWLGARITDGTPKDAPEYLRYVEASPITHVSRGDAPFLLIHGTADTAVPSDQSVAMQAALTAAGVPVSYLPIEGGVHGSRTGLPAEDPRVTEYLRAMTSWLDRYLIPSSN